MDADHSNNTNLATSMHVPSILPIGTNTTAVMPCDQATIKLPKKHVGYTYAKWIIKIKN